MEKIINQADALFKDIKENISLLSNASAFLNEVLENINWVGFYLLIGDKLHLGPFQGKVACTEIELNKGVCGYAFTQKDVINVPDVSKFEGHIVCDSNSKSELVVPLTKNGITFGVLDIDSPVLDRFDAKTVHMVVEIAKLIVRYYDFSFDKL